MKDIQWWEWLLIVETCIVMFWMLTKSFEWLFGIFMTLIFKRDFEQEAIDRVFKNRNIKPGQTVVIEYKNGVMVTMSKD